MAFNPFDIQALFAKQAARPAIGQGQQRQVVDSGPVRRAPVASQQNETAGSSAPNMMGSAAFGGSGGMDKAEGKPSGDGLSFGDRLVGAAIGMSNPGALPGYFKGIQDRRNAALSNQRTMAYLNQMDPESAQLVQAGILSGAQALQRYEAKMQQQQAEQRRRDFMAQVKGIQTTGQMGQPQQQAPAPVPEGEARAQIGVGNSGMTEPAPVQQGGQNGFGADPANLMKMRQQLADYAPFAPDDQSRAYVQDRIALIDSQIAEANKRAAPTDDLREYEYAKKQGYNGTFREFMLEGRKAGATSLTIDNGNPDVGKLSTDYAYVKDPQTGQITIDPKTGLPLAAPVPGSPAARDIAAAEEKARLRAGNASTGSDVVINATKRALAASKDQNFGAYGTSIVGMLPWTDSAEKIRQTEALKDITSFENLNAMRQSSPTGGALGNVSDKEMAMLSRKLGVLDPDSPYFERDLMDYTKALLGVIHGNEAGTAIFNQSFMGGAGGNNAPAPSGGGLPDVTSMSDDELKAIINGR